MFKHTICSQYQWVDWLIKQIKNDYSRYQQDEGFKIILAMPLGLILSVGLHIYSRVCISAKQISLHAGPPWQYIAWRYYYQRPGIAFNLVIECRLCLVCVQRRGFARNATQATVISRPWGGGSLTRGVGYTSHVCLSRRGYRHSHGFVC